MFERPSRNNHGLNVPKDRVEFKEWQGKKHLYVTSSGGVVKTGDGLAMYPVKNQFCDYRKLSTGNLKDTIRLRVLNWRHTFMDFCTDDMRPLEFIGIFHPGKCPQRDRRYHTDKIRGTDREWIAQVNSVLLLDGPRPLVSAYLDKLCAALSQYVEKDFDPLDDVVQRVKECAGQSRFELALALTFLPYRYAMVALLESMDATGHDYLDLDFRPLPY